MKVVLDTNVVVSGAFFGGPPRAVLDAWADGRIEVVISPSIFDEYLRVCDRLRGTYPEADYRAVFTSLLAHGTFVPDPEEAESIPRIGTMTNFCGAPSSQPLRSSQATGICSTQVDGREYKS